MKNLENINPDISEPGIGNAGSGQIIPRLPDSSASPE